MHPHPAFRLDERDAILDHAHRIGFAHIFAGMPEEPMVAHAPVTRHGDALRFHVSRANRIVPRLDGTRLLISAAGPQGYVSASWYPDRTGQVSTWNYLAIEVEGRARRLDRAELLEQLDALAAQHEPADDPWHRSKLAPAQHEALLGAIVGYELTVTAARGTAKLGQNKSSAQRAGVAAGLAAAGRAELAGMMT